MTAKIIRPPEFDAHLPPATLHNLPPDQATALAKIILRMVADTDSDDLAANLALIADRLDIERATMVNLWAHLSRMARPNPEVVA